MTAALDLDACAVCGSPCRCTPASNRGRPSVESIVLPAILAVADADADNDLEYVEAWVRFWSAVLAAGWKPPRSWRPRVLGRTLPGSRGRKFRGAGA